MEISISANRHCCLTCEHLPAQVRVVSDPVVSLKVVLEEQPTTCDQDPHMAFGNGDPRVLGQKCPFYSLTHLVEEYHKAKENGLGIEKPDSEEPKPDQPEETSKPSVIKIQARMDPPEAGTITIGEPKYEKEPRMIGEIIIHPHSKTVWIGLGITILGAMLMFVVMGFFVDFIMAYTRLNPDSEEYATQLSNFNTSRALLIGFGAACLACILIGGFIIAYGGYREKHPKTKK
jgi:hypothetical protein